MASTRIGPPATTPILKDVNERRAPIITSIWDAGGIRQHRPMAARRDTNIDLRAATLQYEYGGGGWMSYATGIYGGFTIANSVTIENATSGSGNDTLTGNNVANVLDGGAGADTMTGARGNDTYIVDMPTTRSSRQAGGGTTTSLRADQLRAHRRRRGRDPVDRQRCRHGGDQPDRQRVRPDAHRQCRRQLSSTAAAAPTCLIGLGGNDTYLVDMPTTGSSRRSAAAPTSSAAQTSYMLAAGAEVEMLSAIDNAGTAAINLTGNELRPDLIGNAGANYARRRRRRRHRWSGFGGNDIYLVDSRRPGRRGGRRRQRQRRLRTTSYALAAGQ